MSDMIDSSTGKCQSGRDEIQKPYHPHNDRLGGTNRSLLTLIIKKCFVVVLSAFCRFNLPVFQKPVQCSIQFVDLEE